MTKQPENLPLPFETPGFTPNVVTGDNEALGPIGRSLGIVWGFTREAATEVP